MRHSILFLLFVFLFVLPVNVRGQELVVNLNNGTVQIQAEQLVNNFLQYIGESNRIGIYKPKNIDDTRSRIVIVYLQPKGYIIFTKKTDLPPCPAFSFTGEGLPSVFLDKLNQRISATESESSNSKNEQTWQLLLQESSLNSFSSQTVAQYEIPDFPTGLSQDNTVNGIKINKYIPDTDGDGNNDEVVGCAPLALARIFNYYGYPSISSWPGLSVVHQYQLNTLQITDSFARLAADIGLYNRSFWDNPPFDL